MCILAIFVLIRAQKYVSNECVGASLLKMSETLKFSNLQASVTLFAIANKAYEIMLPMAIGEEVDDTVTMVSSTFGSIFFTSTLCLAGMIYYSKEEIKLNWKEFIRDNCYLVFVILYILLIGLFYKKVDFWVILSFFLLYAVYIVIYLNIRKE